MANNFVLPTGISAQPIDFTSGATAFMKSAVESRLGEIAASQKQISENKQNVLKALSIKALPDLANQQRDRYQKEIQDYRQGVMDKFKSSEGKLNLQQQREIQDGFVDMQNRMLGEVNQLKQFEEYRKKIYDPNFKYTFDTDKYEDILGSAYGRVMKGEGLGDIAAEVGGAMLAPSVSDYVSKRYDEAIGRLDVQALGEFKGNVFTSTTVQNREEVERLRNEIMSDANVRNRFTANGVVDEVKRAETQQLVEDYVNRKITEVKPYKQTTTGRKEFEPYVVEEKLEEIVPVEGGEISTDYKNSVPMSNVASFVFNGRKMVVESVGYAPVAKDKKAYDKWLSLKLDRFEQVPTLSKHGIIEKKYVDEYEGDIEYKPFAKVGTTKSKNPYASWEEMLGSSDPKDVKVDFLPFEGGLKGAIIAKTLTKKDAYESKFNELDAQMRGLYKKSDTKEVTEVARRTKDGRIAIFNTETEEFIRWQ